MKPTRLLLALALAACGGNNDVNLGSNAPACQALDITVPADFAQCEVPAGYVYLDATCLSICACEGADCDKLFTSASDCQVQTASCRSPTACEPTRAVGQGADCSTVFGYGYANGECYPIRGCSCAGADCDRLYSSEALCALSNQSCRTYCSPFDARAAQTCGDFLGVIWNGQACEPITGCGCAGTDCDRLFDSIEGCQREMANCGG